VQNQYNKLSKNKLKNISSLNLIIELMRWIDFNDKNCIRRRVCSGENCLI